MSHRKGKPAGKPARKRPGMPAQIPPVLPGPFTAATGTMILSDIEHAANDLRKGIGTDPYSKMEQLDPEREILKKLDRKAVNGIPVAYRGDAFLAFHAALWTWLAKKNGLLDLPLECNLIRLGMEPYGKTIPAIAPVAPDVPTFNMTFLAMLQDCIKDRLAEIGFIPQRHLDADMIVPGSEKSKYDLAEAERSKETIPLESYYDITQEALDIYFDFKLECGPERSAVLAETYIRFVFLWLGSTRLLQTIVSRLVNGDPYIRKSRRPDGKYEITIAELGRPDSDR